VPKLILYIATSLDGYIARPDGDISWLDAVARNGEDYGFQAFYDSIDALIVGRNTYDQIAQADHWPHTDRDNYILTHRPLDGASPALHLVTGNPHSVLEQAAARGAGRVWLVGGAGVVAAFDAAHLIDEYIISVVPLLLGDGIPLFRAPLPQRHIELLKAHDYPSGLVQLRYRRM
jgi:dihydrofolate reductase